MFISKIDYNKPCTTNQKPKKLKQKNKKTKDMKFFFKKNKKKGKNTY
jgi:hypothetical protein